MNKALFLFLFIVYLPSASAQSHDSQSQEYRVLKEINLQNGNKAYIIAREDGHLIGQPYQVELRAQCDSKEVEVTKLPVQDSFSVCDLDPKSLKINNQNTAIAMKSKVADLSHYNDQLDRGIASPTVKCKSETTIRKFSLRKLCR